jgi:ABC-type thiamin/hydroxymethylpyrimidine transport system permease subunit
MKSKAMQHTLTAIVLSVFVNVIFLSFMQADYVANYTFFEIALFCIPQALLHGLLIWCFMQKIAATYKVKIGLSLAVTVFTPVIWLLLIRLMASMTRSGYLQYGSNFMLFLLQNLVAILVVNICIGCLLSVFSWNITKTGTPT